MKKALPSNSWASSTAHKYRALARDRSKLCLRGPAWLAISQKGTFLPQKEHIIRKSVYVKIYVLEWIQKKEERDFR